MKSHGSFVDGLAALLGFLGLMAWSAHLHLGVIP
jgi:hypothetical protein